MCPITVSIIYGKQAARKSKTEWDPGENFHISLSKMLIRHLRGDFEQKGRHKSGVKGRTLS